MLIKMENLVLFTLKSDVSVRLLLQFNVIVSLSYLELTRVPRLGVFVECLLTRTVSWILRDILLIFAL